MITGIVIVIFLLVTGSILWYLEMSKKLSAAADREKKLQSTIDELVAYRKKSEESERKPTEEIIRGMVVKNIIISNGRRVTNYRLLNSIPQFSSIEAAVSWMRGICTQVEDPGEIDLAGYGIMMSIDKYIGLKMVMAEVLVQMEGFFQQKGA